MNSPIFSPADILLPKDNFEKWSVIACDQFTSRPDYWEECAKYVGKTPSTLELIYPEVYLSETDRNGRIERINRNMQDYLDRGIYNEYKDCYIYIERLQPDGRKRCGLIGKVDLTRYDYNEGSTSAVRATEKTVLERIPPRVEIRRNAPTELPHIMMLADDPKKTVIEPLTKMKDEGKLTKLYDFELMQGGGYISGWLVPKEAQESVTAAIEALGNGREITLAVGDGNHSLATAKACYGLAPNAVNRYALAEIVNLHSDALEFEPIYRTVENSDTSDVISSFYKFLEQKRAVVTDSKDAQIVTFVCKENETEIKIKNAPHSLAVGTVQMFLDEYVKSHPDVIVDYIHGVEEVEEMTKKEGACGFLYGGIEKSELFPAVEKSGTLPRKTFSMGHARDKRYYIEVRKIK